MYMNHQEFLSKTNKTFDFNNKIGEVRIIINFDKSDTIDDKRIEFDEKFSNSKLFPEKQATDPITKISSLFRAFIVRKSFYENLFKNKFISHLSKSVIIIQNQFRKFCNKIDIKKNLLIKKILTKLNKEIIILQKHVRKYLVYIKYKSLLSNIVNNNLLIIGDYNKILKNDFKHLKLVKYDVVNEEDTITYHNFDYIKSIGQYILFIAKKEFHRENTLVNFYADEKEINNYNFRTIYKTTNKFYNILNTKDLEKREKKYSNHKVKNIFEDYQKVRIKRHFTSNYSNLSIELDKGIKIKRRNSMKKIVKKCPILKSPSPNLIYSSKSSSKRVNFNFKN